MTKIYCLFQRIFKLIAFFEDGTDLLTLQRFLEPDDQIEVRREFYFNKMSQLSTEN